MQFHFPRSPCVRMALDGQESDMSTTTKTPAPPEQSSQRENPLKALIRFGQSIWFDYIRRDLITTGQLARLIEDDGLRGMTSNPTIFEKAISSSPDYQKPLGELARRSDLDAKGIYESLAIRDIQDAADALRGVYDQTKRRDGYVSLEVSPYLAHKTQETMDEARRLWKAVGRAKRDDQGSRDARGDSRDSPADRERHQHQRDASFRAGACMRKWRRRTSPGWRISRRAGVI